MRRYSNFVLKCRILGNRLLFLHSKVDLKPLTALLQIRLNRQARHVLEVQPSCTSTSEHTEAKIRGKFFMLASKGPRVSLPSMCRITHTDAMAMHQPADFPKRLPPVSLSHTVCLSLAACFMPQSFGHAAAIYYYSYHIRFLYRLFVYFTTTQESKSSSHAVTIRK